MEEEEIRAEVTINTKDGSKTYEMVVNHPAYLDDCEKGKLVVLIGHDNSQWSGIFDSVDDEDVIIESIDTPGRKIALPLGVIALYLEEIEEIPYAEEVDENDGE